MQVTYLGIDATNWVHQLWHAQRGLGVVAAVRSRARALIAEMAPAAVVFCFDRRSFRHGLAADYKGHRAKADDSLRADLEAAEREVQDLGFVAAEDGYEADDCLATLAAVAKRNRSQAVLASPDKDLRQCLSSHTLILRSFATQDGRPTKPDWYTSFRLFEEYGLEPQQWIDYQTLVGDSGDGVTGCPGWGEKTAQKVLSQLKTLDACFVNPWLCPCTDKQRGALIQFKRDVSVVRQLVTLQTDVPAVFDALR